LLEVFSRRLDDCLSPVRSLAIDMFRYAVRSGAPKTAIRSIVALSSAWAFLHGEAHGNPAGFQLIDIAGSGHRVLKGAVWYPSSGPTHGMKLGSGEQDVVEGGPVAGDHLPLIVVSHGALGDLTDHQDVAVALAQAGFVVASVSHQEFGEGGVLETVDRSIQLADLASYVLHDWSGHAALDAGRVGAFGFSVGGFTALVAAGGRPDAARLPPHCRTAPTEWPCSMAARPALDLAAGPIPPSAWRSGVPIRAVVLAAPAMGYLFDGGGLANVRIHVQLWEATNDQVLAEPWSAQAVQHDLPIPPELHVVQGADHADFGAPCRPEIATGPMRPFCLDASGFDRTQFHKIFDQEVVRFFRRWLMNAPAN
jgi:predicted dienelactone hydrolase